MSSINALSLRIAVALQCGLVRRRNELGQATSEYGVVILVAIALGLAVLTLFTNKVFDGVLTSLLQTVLKTATKTVSAS